MPPLRTWFSLIGMACVVAACSRPERPRQLRPVPGGSTHTETTHLPAKLTSVPSDVKDALGRTVRVRCASCHSQLDPAEKLPRNPKELEQFHQGLRLSHGSLECTSCHAPGPGSELHLASGETIDTREALRLCAQCHGSQYRDYRAGAHGGMSGSWNRAFGPRLRNHCVDCHDPHAPAYPRARPAPPPIDARRAGQP